MTTDGTLPLEHFIQAVQSQLDNAQTAMAVKARNLNLPLTFAIKDITLDLRAHVEFARSEIRIRPAGAGRQRREPVPPGVHRDHPADDRRKRHRVPEDPDDAIAGRRPDGRGAQEARVERRAHAQPASRADLPGRRAHGRTDHRPSGRTPPAGAGAHIGALDRRHRARRSGGRGSESRRASAAARTQPRSERPAARHDRRRAGQRALGARRRSRHRASEASTGRRAALSTAPGLEAVDGARSPAAVDGTSGSRNAGGDAS